MEATVSSTPACHDEKLKTREQLCEFLNEQGIPVSLSALEKMCMPSRGEGPPAEAYWGPRPLYRPSRGLEWAQARLRKSR
jgi:hypothetical protein